MVETVFKTLKTERAWRTMFETRQDAEQAIGHHRWFLHPCPAPLRARLHKPGPVREDGRQLIQHLSTKSA